MAELVFTLNDLARTRIATGPSPEWELIHSLRMLRGRPIRCFAPWREHVRTRLDRRIAPLMTAAASSDEDPVPALTSRSAAERGTLAWYEELAIAPYWTRIRTLVEADRSRRARILMDGGVDQLLATLHPTVRWHAPVLELSSGGGRPVRHSLDGGGLVLQPSVFVWRAPVLKRRSGGRAVLLYPVSCEVAGGDDRSVPDLATLMGRTRATMLRLLLDGGATTSELARRTELSLPAVSQHVGVLRESGLITTRRMGQARFHALTPLGAELASGVRGTRADAVS